ncbi:hypothetical protein ABFS82_05G013500 [Erythranthe guttata]|uniref:classical arabinogalactan protein 4-like n=1 Tax=Erythranthe guttata TaxID=4155 RepID=UPI00064E03ED|nr:PREDICTED: classical arabinogalactan protein 4-like [Erythranthe guttata]|eukprot:XP_012855161.1 PREDICTED: classical arabinogalactan protein 4-like [Erythranthe guttata]
MAFRFVVPYLTFTLFVASVLAAQDAPAPSPWLWAGHNHMAPVPSPWVGHQYTAPAPAPATEEGPHHSMPPTPPPAVRNSHSIPPTHPPAAGNSPGVAPAPPPSAAFGYSPSAVVGFIALVVPFLGEIVKRI